MQLQGKCSNPRDEGKVEPTKIEERAFEGCNYRTIRADDRGDAQKLEGVASKLESSGVIRKGFHIRDIEFTEKGQIKATLEGPIMTNPNGSPARPLQQVVFDPSLDKDTLITNFKRAQDESFAKNGPVWSKEIGM